MGKQLGLFEEPASTADDRLNAAQAEMRRAQMARRASKPGVRSARRNGVIDAPRMAYCPSCGRYIDVE